MLWIWLVTLYPWANFPCVKGLRLVITVLHPLEDIQLIQTGCLGIYI